MNDNMTICPWSNFTPGYFPICEEALCAWIKQPANVYSNLLFLVVGLYLFLLFIQKKSSHGLILGMCILLIGTASALAHSSSTKLFGFFDFAAIFSVFSYYAAINTKYFYKNIKLVQTALIYFFISVIILYFYNSLREIIFALFIIGLLFSEYKILNLQKKSFFIASYKKVIILFFIGVIALTLDAKKIICDPKNHYLQLHALWHICNAFSLYYLTRHLDQHRPV